MLLVVSMFPSYCVLVSLFPFGTCPYTMCCTFMFCLKRSIWSVSSSQPSLKRRICCESGVVPRSWSFSVVKSGAAWTMRTSLIFAAKGVCWRNSMYFLPMPCMNV